MGSSRRQFLNAGAAIGAATVAERIANPSMFHELFPGDVIYSGTPENAGQEKPGGVMTAHIDGIYDINAKVV